MVSIVEQTAVPLVVSAFTATVKVLVVGTVELVKTIKDVLRSVAVDNVQQHGDSHTVGSVNELLELLWSSIATAGCEEVVDLVSETGIVRMLHHGHQLNNVIPKALDTRKHVLGKLLVGSNSLVGAGDTNVCFVYTSACGFLGPRVLELVGLGGWRVPETGIVCGRYGQVLCHVLDPSRKSINMLAAGQVKRNLVFELDIVDKYRVYTMTNLDFRMVRNGGLTILGRKGNLEDTKIILLHRMGATIPTIW